MKAPGKSWMIFISFSAFIVIVLGAYFTGEVTLHQLIDWFDTLGIHNHE